MDPKATIETLISHLRAGDPEAAKWAADDLARWLLMGGHRPPWSAIQELADAVGEQGPCRRLRWLGGIIGRIIRTPSLYCRAAIALVDTCCCPERDMDGGEYVGSCDGCRDDMHPS